MTSTKHIPSVPLPFPFRSPSVMQVKFKLVGRALTRFLSQTLSPFRSPSVPLPLSFRCAGKTTTWLNAVACHQLKMLKNLAQQTRNAALAKSIHRQMDRGIAILPGHPNCPWSPNGRDEPNPFRSPSVLPRSVRACSFGPWVGTSGGI